MGTPKWIKDIGNYIRPIAQGYLSSDPRTAPFASLLAKKPKPGQRPGPPSVSEDARMIQDMIRKYLPNTTGIVERSPAGSAVTTIAELLAKTNGDRRQADAAAEVDKASEKHGYRTKNKGQGDKVFDRGAGGPGDKSELISGRKAGTKKKRRRGRRRRRGQE